MNLDSPLVSLDKTFADQESQAHPIHVERRRLVQFSELSKQLLHITGSDASPCVHDNHLKEGRGLVVGENHGDLRSLLGSALWAKLERVSDQINQDLRQTHLISTEISWQFYLLLLKWIS